MTNTSTTATEAAAVAAPAAQGAPKKAASKKGAKPEKKTPTAKRGAKQAAPRKAAATRKASPAAVPREGSKKQIVLDLLRRKDGATMAELAKATGWANHSIRGFISGTVGKKMALTVESTKNDAGDRVYHIAR
jgi:hypothetical protein